MPKYKATAYLRLSYTADRSEESDSITNQKKLIEDFIAKHSDIELVSEKVDDGYSGVLFDRPAFREMMSDIMAGTTNCVIVKDDCVIIERKHRKPPKMRVLWCWFCFLTQNRG